MRLLHLHVLVFLNVFICISRGQQTSEQIVKETRKGQQIGEKVYNIISKNIVEETKKATGKNFEENEKPNIIFIMVDDVGWADFGYNTPGSSAIPTPNIDTLAEQGYVLVLDCSKWA